MCRLLGLIANKPVDLEFSLERFKLMAREHPHGWGMGWYEGGEAMIFKQEISALDPESRLPHLSKSVRSSIILCHVRRASRGGVKEENSHPFRFDNWIFAHNGTVHREQLRRKLRGRYAERIAGETDSEVYFRWLLQCLEGEGRVEEGIGVAVEEARRSAKGALNFLLSDGEHLYALRCGESLYRLRREPGELCSSPETGALLRSKLLRGERAVLVCSERLTEEGWEEVGEGNLLRVGGDLRVREVRLL
jgi:glutamine amidotransferase